MASNPREARTSHGCSTAPAVREKFKLINHPGISAMLTTASIDVLRAPCVTAPLHGKTRVFIELHRAKGKHPNEFR
jgi:hypothetical protein